MESAHVVSASPQRSLTLSSLFLANKRQMLLTYGLFNLENLLRLAQPFVLGLAISDLLIGSYFGLGLFVAQHLTHLTIGTLRQMHDTRAFTGMYTDLATHLVVEQRHRNVEVSRVAARSALSREFVDFFERHIPMLIRAAYSIVGGLVMLAVYDWYLVPTCLALLCPAVLINRRYAARTLALSNRLHDEFECEVDVIKPADRSQVRGHYDRVRHWRVKLSDSEALNFCLMELFVLGVLVASLLRVCTLPNLNAGDIYAVFRYVLMLLMGVDSVPMLVQQVSRLKDIQSRLQ